MLIVDDWERLERLEHALAREVPELEVHCAGFGPEGIALALELSVAPDLIYIDLTFENMTEEEAIARIGEAPQLARSRVVRRLPSVDEVLAALRG